MQPGLLRDSSARNELRTLSPFGRLESTLGPCAALFSESRFSFSSCREWCSSLSSPTDGRAPRGSASSRSSSSSVRSLRCRLPEVAPVTGQATIRTITAAIPAEATEEAARLVRPDPRAEDLAGSARSVILAARVGSVPSVVQADVPAQAGSRSPAAVHFERAADRTPARPAPSCTSCSTPIPDAAPPNGRICSRSHLRRWSRRH